MARAKSLSHYPEEYGKLFRAAALELQRHEVEFATMREALSLRGHMYGYIGALRREAERVRQRGAALSPGEQETVDLAALTTRVLINIAAEVEGQPIRMTVCNRNESWQAKAAGRFKLVGTGQPTADSLAEDDALLTKLLAAQAEVPK